MKQEPLLFMSLLGAVGYAVFHGHRLNQGGVIFAGSSIALGG